MKQIIEYNGDDNDEAPVIYLDDEGISIEQIAAANGIDFSDLYRDEIDNYSSQYNA